MNSATVVGRLTTRTAKENLSKSDRQFEQAVSDLLDNMAEQGVPEDIIDEFAAQARVGAEIYRFFIHKEFGLDASKPVNETTH